LFTIGGLTPLTDAARVLKGFFRYHEQEPSRVIGHWSIRRLLLDDEIAGCRIGCRVYIPKTELLAATHTA